MLSDISEIGKYLTSNLETIQQLLSRWVSCHLFCLDMQVYMHAYSVAKLHPTLWPHGCCLPGSSVYGISQARILEWVAIPFSRGSSQPRDRTHVSFIGRRILHHWATREALAVCKKRSFCYLCATSVDLFAMVPPYMFHF